jgi:hypothetical protein
MSRAQIVLLMIEEEPRHKAYQRLGIRGHVAGAHRQSVLSTPPTKLTFEQKTLLKVHKDLHDEYAEKWGRK